MNSRKRVLDLLDAGKLSVSESIEILKILDKSHFDAQDDERILKLLEAGQMSAKEAAELLAVLAAPSKTVPKPLEVEVPPPPKPQKGLAKVLHIVIDSSTEDGEKKANVDVDIPIGLAKFIGKFVPTQAKTHLDQRGIDLSGMLEAINSDAPAGKLIDIDTSDDDGATRTKIMVEVL